MAGGKGRALDRRASIWEFLASTAVRKLLWQAAACAAGFAGAHGTAFGGYAPFGVAAVAAAPKGYLWAALAGAALGYLTSAAQAPVRYLASVLAAAAIRWTLGDLVKVQRHPFYAPLVTFFPLFGTGMALAWVNGTPAGGVALYVAESLLGAGCAYFFSRAAAILPRGKDLRALAYPELVSLAMTGGVLALALSGVEAWGVSLGRVLAVVAVLLAARYGGVAGGAIAGVAAGAMLGLSSAGLRALSGAYALGGLMAGLFSPAGKLASAVAFVFANAAASLQVGMQAQAVSGLAEVAAATLLYFVAPFPSGGRVSGLFSRAPEALHGANLRRSAIMKLDFAAKALGSISDSVEEVSRRLDRLCAPDLNGVYERARSETCGGCGLRLYCWERNYGESMDALNQLSAPLRARGGAARSDLPEPFAGRCGRVDQLLEAVNRHYQEFTMRAAADRRVAQVRAVAAEQFATMAEMLGDMAREMELFERFDNAAAQAVGQVLREAGVLPIDVSCRVDRFGRMSVEVEAAQAERGRLDRAALAKRISQACGRRFDAPCVGDVGGNCRLQMSERPVYHAAAGTAQHVCGNAQLCGDSCELFQDGNGRQIALISDGMGVGGRAAVDGAMAAGIASKLIRAGISFHCALEIVNSALLVKSGDESLATVDLAAVDLFSGKVEIYKAGAPASMARRGGKAERVDAPSLPLGILHDVTAACAEVTLGDGDLLALYSDGVTACGEDWLAPLLEGWDGTPQALAEEIVAQAVARRDDGRDDDVTAVVLQLSQGAAV